MSHFLELFLYSLSHTGSNSFPEMIYLAYCSWVSFPSFQTVIRIWAQSSLNQLQLDQSLHSGISLPIHFCKWCNLFLSCFDFGKKNQHKATGGGWVDFYLWFNVYIHFWKKKKIVTGTGIRTSELWNAMRSRYQKTHQVVYLDVHLIRLNSCGWGAIIDSGIWISFLGGKGTLLI